MMWARSSVVLGAVALVACNSNDQGATTASETSDATAASETQVAADTALANETVAAETVAEVANETTSETMTESEVAAETTTETTESEVASETISETTAETTSGLTPQAFCDALLPAACDWIVKCFPGVTADQCKNYGFMDFYRSACANTESEVAAGRLTFDPAAAQACLDAHHPDVCTFPPPLVRALNFPDPQSPCVGVFKGAVQTEGSCYYNATRFSDECAHGVCGHIASACPGQCHDFVAIDGACSDADSLRCDPATAFCNNGTCAARLALNDECTNHYSACQAGLNCIQTTPGDPYAICLPPRKEGESCLYDGQCLSSSLCAAHVCSSHAELGAHCRNDAQCSTGQHCLPNDTNTDEICKIPNGVGGPCDPQYGYEGCLDGLACDSSDGLNGTCKAFGGVGDSCDSPGCAMDLWCDHPTADTSLCAARVGDGESCSDSLGRRNDACVDGLICMYDDLCHPVGDLGDPCNPTRPDSCASGLQCDRATDTCAAPSALYAPCNPLGYASACESGLYCECLDAPGCPGVSDQPSDREVCVTLLTDGQLCQSSRQCALSNCRGDGPPGSEMHCASSTVVTPPAGCVGP